MSWGADPDERQPLPGRQHGLASRVMVGSCLGTMTMVLSAALATASIDRPAIALAPTTPSELGLASRLLQDGHTLVPNSTSAGWRVRAFHNGSHPKSGRWHIEVDGTNSAMATVDDPLDGVARLELAHRTLELLRRVPPSPAVLPDAIQLKISGAHADAAREQVALGLLAAGLPLTLSPARVRVCVHVPAPAIAQLALVSNGDSCADAVARQLPHAMSELHRVAAKWWPTPGTPPLARSPQDAAERQPDKRVDRRRAPPRFAVGGYIGAVSRATMPDPVSGFAFRYGRHRGIALHVDLELRTNLAPVVRVFEVTPMAGLGGRVPLGQRLFVTLGMQAGPLVHRFNASFARGTRVDALGRAWLGLGVRWSSDVEASLKLRGGLATRGSQYVLDGEMLWRSEFWQLGADFGVSFSWRRRRR